MEEFLNRCVQASEGEVSETLGTDDLVRIGRVQQRLRAEDRRIKDIAEAEGVADYQYFCKLFKRVVGISPGSYRQQPNA